MNGPRQIPDASPTSLRQIQERPSPRQTISAVVFFEHFSKDHPGMFPSAVTHKGPDGKDVTEIKPVKEGSDVQSTFFLMWREEHPDVQLQDVPGDYVTASGSGLDPDITLANAEFSSIASPENGQRIQARPGRAQAGDRGDPATACVQPRRGAVWRADRQRVGSQIWRYAVATGTPS